MVCKNCGAQLNDNSKFCNYCGVQIVKKQKDNSQYLGEIKKCPNCGAPIESFQGKCDMCGIELRNISTPNSINRFKEEIVKIKQKIKTREKGFIFKESVNNKDDIDEELASFISSYPIPNTKEDILEFFVLVKSNIKLEKLGDNDILDDAWVTLLDKVYEKAEMVLSGKELDKIQKYYFKLHDNINKSNDNEKKSERLAVIVGILLFIISFAFWGSIIWSGYSADDKENEYLNTLVKEIEIDIKNKDFISARLKANKLRYGKNNITYSKKWEQQREDLLKIIDELINENNKEIK